MVAGSLTLVRVSLQPVAGRLPPWWRAACMQLAHHLSTSVFPLCMSRLKNSMVVSRFFWGSKVTIMLG